MPSASPASDTAPAFCTRRCQWVFSGLLLLLGLGLTALIAARLQDHDQLLARTQFEHLAQARLVRLHERLDERVRDLESVRYFMEASQDVELHEFRHFTAPLLRDNLALVWAPRLDLSGRDAARRMERFSAEARVQVGSTFRLIEVDPLGNVRPLQPRGMHYPLLFVQNSPSFSMPLGLDLASPGPRREAMLRALASDQARISRSVRLVGPAPEDSQGLLLITPVRPLHKRRASDPAAPPEGVLANGMSLRQLLEAGIGSSLRTQLAVELYDLTDGHGSEVPIYRSGQAADSPLHWQGHFSAGGNTYRLDVRPTAELLDSLPEASPVSALLTGTLLSLLLAVLLFVLLSQRRRALALVAQRTAELRALSITDPLTGIHNRRYFLERFEAELARSQRENRPLALVLLDIDHFKRINDGFGHDVGDLVLQELCRRITSRLRRGDEFCRLGGEEFVVLCPSSDAGHALHLAEALREQVRAQPFPHAGTVTISLGVAASEDGGDGATLLQRADRALYQAKGAGRDRVCLDSGLPG